MPGRPGALMAHADLEDLTLERDLHHEKARLEPRWSELVYDGLWFSPLKQALDAFINETQRHVTGEVRLRFAAPGTCAVVGRRSPVALYDHGLATYDASDTFRHADAEGFVRLWGLGVATWSARQGPGAEARPSAPGSAARPGMTLWQGRISTGMADDVADFTVSLPFDRVLATDDLAGSRAHVKGLGKAGILDDGEVTTLVEALDPVEAEFAAGTFVFAAGRRGHPHRDRAPRHRAGGRRRRQAAHRAEPQRPGGDRPAAVVPPLARRRGRGAMALQDVLAQRAREAADAYLPGYTHLQRAQPVLLAHHLLAHGWALARDVDRLLATVDRLNVSPLGAGALAGSSLPLDPDFVAAELGSTAASRTPSMPSPTATSWPRPSSTWPCSACTCRGWVRSSCCGRPRSSASAPSTTPTPPAARCCRRRRTPTWPSWRGARPAGSSATSRRCWSP